MSADSDSIRRPESLSRVVVCRFLSFVAALSLWHIPDWAAAVIYAVGALVYYIPYAASSPGPPPAWLRWVWFAVVAVIGGVYFFAPSAAPAGSVMPPEFKYGLLAIIAVQVVFDFYRQKRLRAC